MSDTAPVPQPSPDMRRRHDGIGGTAIVGVVLILLGVAFLMERSGYLSMTGNWWALFIYVAAVASLVNSWRSYHATGVFGSAATGSLIWALVLTVVATILFFDLLWDVWWPAILVAVGMGMVTGSLLGSATGRSGGTSA
jgi:hypothetical protein